MSERGGGRGEEVDRVAYRRSIPLQCFNRKKGMAALIEEDGIVLSIAVHSEVTGVVAVYQKRPTDRAGVSELGKREREERSFNCRRDGELTRRTPRDRRQPSREEVRL